MGLQRVRHDWEIDTQVKNKYEINEIRNSSLKKHIDFLRNKVSQGKANKMKPKTAKIRKVTLAKSCLSCMSTDSLISIFPISFTLNIKQPLRGTYGIQHGFHMFSYLILITTSEEGL